jgi:uncharacterized membrane protein YdjX (TVP38/TMEM64 family)
MSDSPRKPVNFTLIWVILVAVLVIATAFLAFPYWWPLFEDPQKLRTLLTSAGIWAPIIFVFLQALQIVVFALPGEVTQIAAGWVFGFGWGTVLIEIGTVVGSATAFALARKFGPSLVHNLAGPSAVAKFDGLMQSPRFIGSIFLLFLIPGIPKDILCYVAGLSQLRFLPFLIISLAARQPGILGSSLMGKALYQGDWWLLAAVAGGALVLFGVGWFFRESIFRFIERFATKHKDAE